MAGGPVWWVRVDRLVAGTWERDEREVRARTIGGAMLQVLRALRESGRDLREVRIEARPAGEKPLTDPMR